MNFKESYDRKKKLVEDHILNFLPKVQEESDILYQSMRYSLEAGGKRLRPVLLLSACEFCEGNQSEALPFACALEMIHTYSLIHDDLPAMDNDDFRRGKPSNHKVFGEATAILAGDGLLNAAMELICSDILKTSNSPEITKKKLLASQELFQASGCQGMIGGQIADIQAEGNTQSEDLLHYIHMKKTSALLTSSVRAGAILGDANETILADLTEFAKNMGLVFQITDDILDICGQEQLLGKAIGSDVKHNKLTYPSLYGLDRSKVIIKELNEESIMILDKYNHKGVFLKNLLEFLLDRSF